MKWNESPHIELENHYEIRKLFEFQEKNAEKRTRFQAIEKARDLIQKDIAGFKDIEVLDFYCKTCKKDFVARARKQIDNWDKNKAYYKIKCRKGHWNIRHITDRFKDPYFFWSRKVARDRFIHYQDSLQSFQTGFNMVYGKTNNK